MTSKRMRLKIVAAVILLLGLVPFVFAGDAKHCVKLGYYKASYGASGDSQTLTNTCDKKIHIVWCHDNTAKKYKSSLCGRKGRYYQQNTVLKPGEVKNNQYSLPASGSIYFGACFGGWYTTKTKNFKNGDYACK